MSEEKHDEGGSHGGGHGGAHGGGGHAEGEHEGAPEWLISFADNVALLMGFFVILLAMNMAPKSEGPAGGKGQGGAENSRMVDFVIAVREGFNNPISVNSRNPDEQPFVRRIIEREAGQGESPGIQGKFQNKQSLERGTAKDVTARISFPGPESVELTPAARATIAATAQKVKSLGYVIEVRGHASQFEAMKGFDSANRLSFERAMVVAKALVENGVARENISIGSRGDADRLRKKTFDPDEAQENQRVEVIVTNEPLAEDHHAAPRASAGGH